MTKIELLAQIDAQIKANTSGTDFITPAELNAILKAIVNNSIIVGDIPEYDSLADATSAIGVGKVIRISDASNQAPEGTLMTT